LKHYFTHRRTESEFAALQARIERHAEQEIQNQLQRYPLETKEGRKQLEAFIDRISDRRKNLNIKPEFTPQVVGVCQQILAFGMAGLGLVVAFGTRIADAAPFWQSVIKMAFLFALNLTAIAFFVLVWFFVQARSRYPFLFLERLGNAPPFFYYETLSRTWKYSPISTVGGIFQANQKYLEDFTGFAKKLVDEDHDPIQRAKYELQQYFLLIVYQGYLDQYEMQLEHIFLYASLSAVLSALVIWRWLLV
jgi:hypothetical protein